MGNKLPVGWSLWALSYQCSTPGSSQDSKEWGGTGRVEGIHEGQRYGHSSFLVTEEWSPNLNHNTPNPWHLGSTSRPMAQRRHLPPVSVALRPVHVPGTTRVVTSSTVSLISCLYDFSSFLAGKLLIILQMSAPERWWLPWLSNGAVWQAQV